MDKVLLVACDDHSKTMVLKVGVGQEKPVTWRAEHRRAGWAKLIARLQAHAQQVGATRTVCVYEASGLGFGLHDALRAAGIECHVLAPSKLQRAPADRQRKDDERDAEWLYEVLRGHVLAGNRLPRVHVPDRELRDQREVLRTACDVVDKQRLVKQQIGALLRRNNVDVAPQHRHWTSGRLAFLRKLSTEGTELGAGAQVALRSLLRQLEFLKAEEAELHKEITKVAAQPRYRKAVQALDALRGVGLVLGLAFLLELGDPRRFRKRKAVGEYLGLAPSRYETGGSGERKGHITRQGSALLRRLLCQAAWARIRGAGGEAEEDRAAYRRIVARHAQRKKIAIVAVMRRLGGRMHRVARAVVAGDAAGWPELKVVEQ